MAPSAAPRRGASVGRRLAPPGDEPPGNPEWPAPNHLSDIPPHGRVIPPYAEIRAHRLASAGDGCGCRQPPSGGWWTSQREVVAPRNIRNGGSIMLKLLIVYGSTEGQTRRIANFIAGCGRESLHHVRELDSTMIQSNLRLMDYDAVIVGASVHDGRHQSSVEDFVRGSLDDLNGMPSAFFSVSLAAALPDPVHQREARRYISEFLAATGWSPTTTRPVAGALAFTRHDYLRRLSTTLIGAQTTLLAHRAEEGQYTDWEGVRAFTSEFVELAERRQTVPLQRMA
jgi:menaquinone-dependent protoporphyrinogen oxidase